MFYIHYTKLNFFVVMNTESCSYIYAKVYFHFIFLFIPNVLKAHRISPPTLLFRGTPTTFFIRCYILLNVK